MKKISKVDACRRLDEIDLKVMDQELGELLGSDQRNKREMSQQFYLTSDGDIILQVYWDKDLVLTLRFENKSC